MALDEILVCLSPCSLALNSRGWNWKNPSQSRNALFMKCIGSSYIKHQLLFSTVMIFIYFQVIIIFICSKWFDFEISRIWIILILIFPICRTQFWTQSLYISISKMLLFPYCSIVLSEKDDIEIVFTALGIQHIHITLDYNSYSPLKKKKKVVCLRFYFVNFTPVSF